MNIIWIMYELKREIVIKEKKPHKRVNKIAHGKYILQWGRKKEESGSMKFMISVNIRPAKRVDLNAIPVICE